MEGVTAAAAAAALAAPALSRPTSGQAHIQPLGEQESVSVPVTMISDSLPVVPDKMPEGGMAVDFTVIQDAIKAVIEPRHGRLPADPYRDLIQNILSSEFSEGVLIKDRPPPAAELFPDRSDTLIEQLVSFGDCGGFGLIHLAKLISDAAVQRSASVLDALLQALGNLKSEVKTKGIETVFIDVASINTCVSEVLAQPLHHRYEVAVEAIVTNIKVPVKEGAVQAEDDGPKGASFDECIMSFVRRIMEEAFQAEQSEDILCAEITAVMGSNANNVQRIDVRNMRERRQQVLSILKAATVGEGAISMEIFLKVKHNLLNFNKDSHGYTTFTGTNVPEETTGYMRIVRHYRFSYCDNNSNFKRCFSKLPFESLARGVFFDGAHAKIYRDVYAKHLAKMNQTQADRAAELYQRDARDKAMDDKLFTGVFFMMIKSIRQALGSGEYVYAAEWLMQLNTLMNPNKMNVTYSIARISQICSSDIGKVRAVRDALASLTSVCEIVRRRIVDYVSKNPESGRNARGARQEQNAKPVSKDLLAIRTHYEAISKGIVEIRILVLALLRNVHYSDFRYVSVGLQMELWELFQDDRRTPLTTLSMTSDDEEYAMSPRAHGTHLGEERLLEMSGILSSLDGVYKKLECRLQILESSMGLSCLLNLIKIDKQSAEARGLLEFKRLDEEKAKEKAKYFIKRNFDENEWNKRDIRYALHQWNETPRTVWELLGYIESYYRIRMNLLADGLSANARSADMKISWYLDLDVSNGQIGTFRWREGKRGKDVDSLIKYVLFDPWTEEHGNTGKDILQKDKHKIATNADGTPRTLGLWDAESILRCAPAELVLHDMVADEQGRFETPKFLAPEAARIRYLTETHVLRALHEGVYTAMTSKDVGASHLLPFYASVSQSLFHFSAYLHLWNNLKSSEIAQYVFAAARTKGGISYVEECCGCSAVYTSFRPVPGKMLKYISGGVFAPNRLLTCLGYKVQDIFVQTYSLPALFNSLPAAPSGMSLQTYCGLTFGTALHWGMSNHLTAIDEGKEEAYTEAIRMETDHAAGNRLLLSQLLANKEALKYVKTSTVVALDYPPAPLELEVALRYNCEFLAAEPRARKSFGAEVSKCIHFLAGGTDWRVTSIAVAHAAGATTSGDDGLPHPKRLVFTRQQVIEDRDYDASMQMAAGKFGFVSVDCAVAIPEPKQPPKEGPAATGKPSPVITLALLTQAFEKVIQRFDSEDKQGYDPCGNDRQRTCASDNSVNSILQEHILRKKNYPRAFVPCRINFSFLSSTPVDITKKKKDLQLQLDDDSDNGSMDSRRQEMRQRRRAEAAARQKEAEKLGILSTGNEHLARLVASTIWLSPNSAKGIWGCVQKPGEVQRCYDMEFRAHMRTRDILRSRNLCVDAIAHHKVACALSLKYDNFVHCTRMNTALAVTFQKTFLMLRMSRAILQDREVTTLDVGSFRTTLVKYVCLGLRMGLLSPQCVHLRSGVHQILDLVLQLEGLLKLVPLPIKITKPTIVLAEGGTEKFRITGAITTDQEASWDETELRKVLGQPTTVSQATSLLVNLERKCAVLLEALARDVDTLLFQFTHERQYNPQSYQMLDPRDVVNRNEEKMKNIFRTTLVAHDLIQEKSMFDRAGDVKFEDQSPIKPYYKFQDTVSSLGDTFGATEQKITLDDDGNEIPEEVVSHAERINALLDEGKGMECVLGDLSPAEYRKNWVAREREFAFTETGRLLAEKSAEAAAAIEAAAVRGHARENIGKRGSGGRGLSYAINEEEEDDGGQDDGQNLDIVRANTILNAEEGKGVGTATPLRSRVPSASTLQRPAQEEIRLSRTASRVPSTASLKSTAGESPANLGAGPVTLMTPMAVNINTPSASSVVNKLRMSVGKVKMGNFMDKIKAGAAAA